MKEIITQIFQIIKEKKTQSIIILGLLILTIIIIIFLNMNLLNNNKNKLYPNNDYIFTYNDNQLKNKDSILPFINLTGDDAIKANKNIKSLYYENDILKEGYLNYKYYINDDIISLIIEKYLYSVNDSPSNTYFYNFSISNKKLLSNNELKNIYNITDDEIENKIISQIKKYYDYELKKQYINSSECNFECYKNGLDDNIEFYVKDKVLYAYIIFSTDYMFAYDTEKPFSYDINSFKLN